MDKAKPFCISKQEVWDAYERVKANHGAAGVDGQSVAAFEENLINNLYKLWNRLSSGSYFPPPVRRVEIPKSGGGTRPLGIPTVADRIAQMVVKRCLEPNLDRLFHPDSYGYRPGKSAIEAVGQARQRCWDYDWVLDLDIRGFLDRSSQYPPADQTSSKSAGCWSSTLIRRPFRFPRRTCTAWSSPRFTRCHTV